MSFKLAILSDVHADLDALRDALVQIERLGCDRCICAGDLVDWGEFPDETIALLQAQGISCIRGNHDRWAVESGHGDDGARLSPRTLKFLASLPTHLRLTLEGVRVDVWHARPGSDMRGIERDSPARHELSELVNPATTDVLVVGHTHQPFLRRLAGRLVVNPGSLLREPSSRTSSAIRSGTFGILTLPGRSFSVHRASDGEEIPTRGD